MEPWLAGTDLDGLEESGVMEADMVDRKKASGMQTAWVEVPELVGPLGSTHYSTRTRKTNMSQADGVVKRLVADMAPLLALGTQKLAMRGWEVIGVWLETCSTMQALCSRCPLYRDLGCAGLCMSRSMRWRGW